MPRWPGCTAVRADRRRSSTTTSPGPSRTATSRCTPWCATRPAGRSRSRSAPQAMHDHAEHGVAAHWAYKEAGAKGYAGVAASGEYDAKIAVLRQLLAWERDLAGSADGPVRGPHLRADAARPPSSNCRRARRRSTSRTRVHTSLGHRCRGARVDGAMVPLNTPLQNGQTVEIVAAKEGGPSRDWLNPELGFLASHRARAKVRAWFNEQVAPRDRRARPRGGREAAAARRQDGDEARATWRRSWASSRPTTCSSSSARTSSRCATSRCCCIRPEAPLPAGRRPAAEEVAAGRALAQGRRAGGGRRFADDAAGACCKPAPPDADRAASSRAARASASTAPTAATSASWPARNAERVIEVEWGTPKADGQAGVPGRRGRRGGGPAGPAARHLRGVRQGEDERRSACRRSRCRARRG